MGSIYDALIREKIPDAQVMYFSTFPDLVMALKSHKIDALPNLMMVQCQYMRTDDSRAVIDEEIGRVPAGYHGNRLRRVTGTQKDGYGFPVLQPLRTHDCHRECHVRAGKASRT